MIDPEVAKYRLEEWKLGEEFVPDFSKLKKELKAIGYSLFECDENGKSPGSRERKKQAEIDARRRELDQLTAKDRLLLFRQMFAGLGPAVEQTWQWLKTAPAGSRNGDNRYFLNPHHPEQSYTERLRWLENLLRVLTDIDRQALSTQWLATWSNYLPRWYGGDTMGILLAATIDGGSHDADEVYSILTAAVRGEHEIAGIGLCCLVALLACRRPEAWELVEKTLVAAQRQEGLRQTILGCMPLAHPEAFARMLKLIVDARLARFSSVAQAIDEWFALSWDSQSTSKVEKATATVWEMITSPQARQTAFAGNDAERIYFALWAEARLNVESAYKPAETLLDHSQENVRFAVATILSLLRTTKASALLAKALRDKDLRVAMVACSDLQTTFLFHEEAATEIDCFDSFQELFARTPAKPRKMPHLLWPWEEFSLSRSEAALGMVSALGDRCPTTLMPLIKSFDSSPRQQLAQRLANTNEKSRGKNPDVRRALLELLGDASADVWNESLTALADGKAGTSISADEAPLVEAVLHRKTALLRQGAMELLIKQKDAEALASAERLLFGKDRLRHLAGLELIRRLIEADRGADEGRALATRWRDAQKQVESEHQNQLDSILQREETKWSPANAFGLADLSRRTPPTRPNKPKVVVTSPAAALLIKSLDDFIHKHRERRGTVYYWNDYQEEELLGEISYFPSPDRFNGRDNTPDRFPFRELFEEWNRERPKATRDKDGLELIRTQLLLVTSDLPQKTKSMGVSHFRSLLGTTKLPAKIRYWRTVDSVLDWLILLYPTKGQTEFALSALEYLAASMPEEVLPELIERLDEDDYEVDSEGFGRDWREANVFYALRKFLQRDRHSGYDPLDDALFARYWKTLHWLDEPTPGVKRRTPSLDVLARAHQMGLARDEDIFDELVNGLDSQDKSVTALTHIPPEADSRKLFEQCASMETITQQCVSRWIEIELARGEAETEATRFVRSLSAVQGIDILKESLRRLGKTTFKLDVWGNEQNCPRPVFTRIAQVTAPATEDTPERFRQVMSAEVQAGSIPEDRLLELTFLNARWAPHIEHYFGWKGLTEGVYWFLAHMRWAYQSIRAINATEDDVEETTKPESGPKQKSKWDRIIAERTALSEQDRREGAIDVPWFHRVYRDLTPNCWERLAAAARYSASVQQAKRAKFIGEVLMGKVDRKELLTAVRDKKLKEQVRLLGLLPLAEGKARDADLQERYQALQEYRRYAKTLSSMTQEGAFKAVEIGLQNLAMTAGYRDPLRLQWALEAESTRDLAAGPVVVKKGDLSVTLQLNSEATPSLTYDSAGKPIKSLPAKFKKEPAFVELQQRSKDLKRQATQVRLSLEAAMMREDTFSGSELMRLADHALVFPFLQRLVLAGEGIMGYPIAGGKGLRDFRGKVEPVKKGETLRIAHPHHLFADKSWADWQHECFQNERVQPFKQVFRELYPLTKQERSDKTASHRYAGQQVRPRQAFALWRTRGWHADWDEVFKSFPNLDLTVNITFNRGYTTPLEIEGLTFDAVEFYRRSEYEPLPIAEVSPILFSEIMRDLDLVVSVAHRGGVDPEASASTVQMRENLLREACVVLGLKNVRIQKDRAIIKGTRGDYTVHLGSGVVHRMPGGAICLVPVHSQHRGRIFLPFADDDSKTAEVLSKTVLLARDEEIKDPILLDQLRAMA